MATLTLQNLGLGGIAPSFASAAAGGDVFPNASDERTFFWVENGSGASINVTFTAQRTSQAVPGAGALTIPDKVVAVPANARRLVGPFPEAYNNSDGRVAVSYSAVTSVTVAAIRMARNA